MVAYETVEGQTAKIARFAHDRLREAGREVTLIDTADPNGPVSFAGVEKVVLAAPVHERRHPRAFEVFVAANLRDLSSRDTLMISVSLSAAFPVGMEEAADYMTEFKSRTAFSPGVELLVAGAVRPSSYDYFETTVLRHVVLHDHAEVSPGEEREFTDWDALAKGLAAFAAQ